MAAVEHYSLPTTTYLEFSEAYYYDFSYDYSNALVCKKEDIKDFGKVFFPILYTLLCIAGLIGNAFLACIAVKYIKRRRTTYIYLLNLAISDLLFVMTLPFWATYAASEWIFGSILCKVVSFIYSVNFYSGIFFMVCMSLDMYLQVVHAFSSKNFRTVTKSTIISSVVWLFAIMASIPDVLFTQLQTEDERNHCGHSYGNLSFVAKMVIQFELNIIGFFIPFLFILFFYTYIYCRIYKSNCLSNHKALKLVLPLVAVFFTLWFPYNLVLLLHSLQELHVFSDCEMSKRLDYALQVTECLAFVHCCLNPFLFAFVKKRFRQYLKDALIRIFHKGGTFVLKSSETSQPSNVVSHFEMTTFQNL
ncbi:atypical chemokine receptor 2 [Protopterus annectens]|uniref:atypical chemokine receptor 2 n=1 Tax=Protopterus annectens TaxID=7888 RepID=UPI001CFAB0E0|nr:atypical chemokine receptor 2 [Protopterus annectens]